MMRTAILGVLSLVTFQRSCVDMGWAWDVEEVFDREGSLRGFLIRTTFRRPDRDPPHEVRTGYGGWHFLPRDADVTAIVKRAYVAADAILRHELMEAFHVEGNRIFDPHHDLYDLQAACESARDRR